MDTFLIIADCPFYIDKTHGGLQKRFIKIVKELCKANRVHLFCGVDSDIEELNNLVIYKSFDNNCEFIDAYQDTLNSVSKTCKLLISLETEIPIKLECKSILLLGGLAYDWSFEIALGYDFDCYVVPSCDSKYRLSQRIVSDQEKIRVIPNGYEYKSIKPTSVNLEHSKREGLKLIFPHRLSKGKGIFSSLKLVKHLNENNTKCTLYVPVQDFYIVDKEFYEKVIDFLTRNNIENVVFHEWVDIDLVPDYFSSADLTLALGAINEGFGASIIESIYYGTPVLATIRGAVPELLPSNCGLYLVQNEYSAILEAGKDLTKNIHTYKEQCKAGKAYIEQEYSLEKMVSEYMELFDQIAKQ